MATITLPVRTEPSGPEEIPSVDEILADFEQPGNNVIPILQRIQDRFGYVPRPILAYISRKTLIPLQQLYGVVTFYSELRLAPYGKHVVRICDGTSCHVNGAAANIEAAQNTLGIAPGQTTPDRNVTLQVVYCLGACHLSPSAVIDGKIAVRLTPKTIVDKLKWLH